jgi:pimeloyl-ACP methyl ester carboxylesterase
VNQPTQPAEVHHGLAIYQRGAGPPLLVFPYPHASGGGPMIDGALASIAIDCGFRAATFDPPGLDRSTRTARVGLEETLDCGTETLDVLRLPERVVVLGHSMSALCAFYFALAHPERVARLVLVGTPPGSGMAIVRYRAMPFQWPPWHPNLWRMVGWGILLAQGRGSLETHKKMDLLRARANFVNQALVPPIVIQSGDRRRAAPPRDRWWLATRKTRLVPRASELRCPTLLIVGRHDPQTPVRVSRMLNARIPDSQLVIFERSGHSPFVEEPERFAQVLGAFAR